MAETKICIYCGAEFARKHYKHSNKEPLPQWNKRHWCEAEACVKRGRKDGIRNRRPAPLANNDPEINQKDIAVENFKAGMNPVSRWLCK